MNKLLWLLPLLLLGCAGAQPETSYYLLRGDPTADLPAAPASIALGRVAVAGYLDQSGLVLETGDNEIESARAHLWAEPLNQGIRSFLRDAVSRQLGFDVAARVSASPQHVVHVYLDQLHGSIDGNVVMVADVNIESRGASTDTFRLVADRRISRDGYPALVDAEKQLLEALAQAIAEHLSRAVSD